MRQTAQPTNWEPQHTVQSIQLKQAFVQPPTTFTESPLHGELLWLDGTTEKTMKAGDTSLEEPLTHDTCMGRYVCQALGQAPWSPR